MAIRSGCTVASREVNPAQRVPLYGGKTRRNDTSDAWIRRHAVLDTFHDTRGGNVFVRHEEEVVEPSATWFNCSREVRDHPPQMRESIMVKTRVPVCTYSPTEVVRLAM